MLSFVKESLSTLPLMRHVHVRYFCSGATWQTTCTYPSLSSGLSKAAAGTLKQEKNADSFDGEQCSSFCLAKEMPQRCRLPCRYASLVRWTSADPPRWSPSTTHVDRNTHPGSRGWMCEEQARLIATEHAHRSNFTHKAESTSIRRWGWDTFTLSLSCLQPLKKVIWLQRCCVLATVEGFKQWRL